MPSIVTERSRLDVFLAREQSVMSRVKAGALIRKGCVTVNGRIARKPAQIVLPGDRVEVTASHEPASESHIQPVDLKLRILYEDAACLVIHKPAGIAVHPARGIPADEPTILNGIAFLFRKRRAMNGALTFCASSVLAHRLDRETTGCLLIAKSPQAHRALQEQFKSRTVKKTYLAIVAGIPEVPEAHIDAPIGRSMTHRTKMSVTGASRSRSARTTYRVLAASREAALLACDLHTGRTHQIRVHVSAIGHPVIGDTTYGTPQHKKNRALCLHARSLTFVSPALQRSVTARAPLPPAFRESLRSLALPSPPRTV